MEAGDASGTGWLDVRTRDWSAAMLNATDPQRDLASCLPPLVPANASFPIAPGIAAELGLQAGVRVSAGGGDNMMAAIGTGNVAPGMLTMSLGTSGTLFACADRPVVDERGGWAAFCSSTGGWLRAFGFDSHDADSVLAGTRPGAGGLMMLPFFNGERTPDLPRARASIHGLDHANFTRANALRAAMEGATYALCNGIDALRAAGLEFSSIRLTGGGSRSAVWRQMIADVFDLPVEMPVEQEGAAFGAALQALWACTTSGTQAQIDAITREHVLMGAGLGAQPDAAAGAEYRVSYERFLNQLRLEIDRSSHPQST
jgi:xylulokinase